MKPITQSVSKECDPVRDRRRGSGLGFKIRTTPGINTTTKRPSFRFSYCLVRSVYMVITNLVVVMSAYFSDAPSSWPPTSCTAALYDVGCNDEGASEKYADMTTTKLVIYLSTPRARQDALSR
jgi:hypothetical protein